jgi:hypothetical protein
MLENPYQPPKIDVVDEHPSGARPRKRLRIRLIPATLCFVYGGIGLAGCAFLAVTAITVIARVGPERFHLVRMFVAFAVLCGVFGLVVGSGWLWLRGKWLGAAAALVMAFLVGLAERTVIESLNGGKSNTRDFYRVFIKPDPAFAVRQTVDGSGSNAGERDNAYRSTLRHP